VYVFLHQLITYSQVSQKTGCNGAERAGFLKNRAIQDIINHVWFKSAKADAVLLPDHYQSFPLVALALLFTAVRSISPSTPPPDSTCLDGECDR